MAQKQARRFPQEHHPFSLLTLIQSPKPPGLVRREEGLKGEQGNSEEKETSSNREEEEEVRLMNRQQQLVRREPESAGFLLGEQQQQNSFSSRATHCQTVAADLSLHSSTSSYQGGVPPTSTSFPSTSASSFPPTSEPPPLFYPLLPARTPLTHNLAGYDFYQQGAGEFASEGLPPPAPQPFSDYQEYYDRWLFHTNCCNRFKDFTNTKHYLKHAL